MLSLCLSESAGRSQAVVSMSFKLAVSASVSGQFKFVSQPHAEAVLQVSGVPGRLASGEAARRASLRVSVS